MMIEVKPKMLKYLSDEQRLLLEEHDRQEAIRVDAAAKLFDLHKEFQEVCKHPRVRRYADSYYEVGRMRGPAYYFSWSCRVCGKTLQGDNKTEEKAMLRHVMRESRRLNLFADKPAIGAMALVRGKGLEIFQILSVGGGTKIQLAAAPIRKAVDPTKLLTIDPSDLHVLVSNHFLLDKP